MKDNLKEWDILHAVFVLFLINVPLFWFTRASVNRVSPELQAERAPMNNNYGNMEI